MKREIPYFKRIEIDKWIEDGRIKTNSIRSFHERVLVQLCKVYLLAL